MYLVPYSSQNPNVRYSDKKCCADLEFNLPYEQPSDVRLYVYKEVIGVDFIYLPGFGGGNLPLSNFDISSGTDGNGVPFWVLQLNATPIVGGLFEGFYFILTYSDNTSEVTYFDYVFVECSQRCAVRVKSNYAKFDCLNRWYGDVRIGTKFSNEMLIWAEVRKKASEFNFTNFDACQTTKTLQTQNFELRASEYPEQMMPYVEAVLGRGVIEIDNSTYQVGSKSFFTEIKGFGKCQYNLSCELKDCTCTVNHECDSPVVSCEGLAAMLNPKIVVNFPIPNTAEISLVSGLSLPIGSTYDVYTAGYLGTNTFIFAANNNIVLFPNASTYSTNIEPTAINMIVASGNCIMCFKWENIDLSTEGNTLPFTREIPYSSYTLITDPQQATDCQSPEPIPCCDQFDTAPLSISFTANGLNYTDLELDISIPLQCSLYDVCIWAINNNNLPVWEQDNTMTSTPDYQICNICENDVPNFLQNYNGWLTAGSTSLGLFTGGFKLYVKLQIDSGDCHHTRQFIFDVIGNNNNITLTQVGTSFVPPC
jgi:hypothetical protein